MANSDNETPKEDTHHSGTGPPKTRRTRKRNGRSKDNLPAPRRACNALTKAGNPCPIWPPPGKSFCFQHDNDPEVAAYRHASRLMGGTMATHKRFLPEGTAPPDLSNSEGIRKALEDNADQVRKGLIAANVANAVAYSISTALRLVSVQVAKLEKQILEQKRGRQ